MSWKISTIKSKKIGNNHQIPLHFFISSRSAVEIPSRDSFETCKALHQFSKLILKKSGSAKSAPTTNSEISPSQRAFRLSPGVKLSTSREIKSSLYRKEVYQHICFSLVSRPKMRDAEQQQQLCEAEERAAAEWTNNK
ncbi:hypothetical protein CHARACLAT_001118 [Characodon lateralis]|uniref:Uncharacterized protein n=1 Tax=Characodon lateralis TaxID=208331 RepID=A0ABU7ER07_9TELE|nr:hypothetical protein [Characodon lateralis]